MIDGRCIKVVVLDHDGLEGRYRTLEHDRGPKASIAGFHRRTLGTDNTVL